MGPRRILAVAVALRRVTGEEWLDLSAEEKRAIAEDFGPDFTEDIPGGALIDFALGAARDGPPLGTGTGTATTGG